MTRLFQVQPERSRTITFIDILIVFFATFVCFPAIMFGIGYLGAVFLMGDADWIAVPLTLIYSFGITGIFAWLSLPVALGLGWLATRHGWIGPLAAPLLGALGGLLFSLVFYLGQPIDEIDPTLLSLSMLFMGYAAIYGTFAWLVLRWLRPDVFASASGRH